MTPLKENQYIQIHISKKPNTNFFYKESTIFCLNSNSMYETLVCPKFPGYSLQEQFYAMFQSNLEKRSPQSNKEGKLWKLNKIKPVSFSHSTLHANEPCDHQEGYCNLSQWYLITEPFAQTANILTWEMLLVCFRLFKYITYKVNS